MYNGNVREFVSAHVGCYLYQAGDGVDGLRRRLPGVDGDGHGCRPRRRRRIGGVVLSDRTIERLLGEGRIEIDPYDPALLQPSSVDVRVDRYFRVFRNSRYPFIDVKQEQEDLTELVEIGDEPFILHPGEFVLGSTLERVKLPDDLVARLEGKSSLGPARPADPLDRRLHRPGLGRPRHARALERRQPADHDLPRDEDRPALVRPAVRAGGEPVRQRRARLEVPGPAGADAEPVLAEISSSDPRHRRNGLRRAEGRPRAARRGTRRARLVRKPERAATLRRWGVRARRRATSPTRRACGARSAGCDAVVHLVAIIAGKPADFERVMVGGTREPGRRGAGGGRPPLRPDERARCRASRRGR